MGNTYFVPVQASKAGTLTLRTGRLWSGERVGLAFTSENSFRLTMGPSGQWANLGGQALRDMLAPLGVEHLMVDPPPRALGRRTSRGENPDGHPGGREQRADDHEHQVRRPAGAAVDQDVHRVVRVVPDQHALAGA